MSILFALLSLCASARAETVRRADHSILEYTLKRPAQNQKFALAIVLQGSGCESIAAGMSELWPTLNGVGFAVLTVEKPGIHGGNAEKRCPEEYLRLNTIQQRITDLRTVFEKIRKDDVFLAHWNGVLVWAGGSEGATVASMAAPLFKETTAVALYSGGGGMTMADELKLLTAKRLRARGRSEAEVRESLAGMDAKMGEIRANPTPDKNWLGETNTYRWWASILDLDIAGSLRKISARVYLAHGTADQSVPIESADLLAREHSPAPFGQWTYARYEGLGHKLSQEAKVGILLWMLVQEDQRLRLAGPEFLAELKARDAFNRGYMRFLLDKGMYPLISTYGLIANRNAWLLIQHADEDPDLQKRVLEFLETALKRQDTFAADVAALRVKR